MAEDLNDLILAMFEHTRNQVDVDLIVSHMMGDPGTPDYINTWTGVWRSGPTGKECNFDLSENMFNVCNGAKPEKFTKDDWRFYPFAVSVGLVFEVVFAPKYEICPGNHLAQGLVLCQRMDDLVLSEMSGELLLPLAEHWQAQNEPEEAIFFTLAAMVVAHRQGKHETVCALAFRLIEEDQAIRLGLVPLCDSDCGGFALDLTCFDGMHVGWKRLIKELTNPLQNEWLQMVIDALDATTKRRW